MRKLLILCAVVWCACTREDHTDLNSSVKEDPLFEKLSPATTGIDFVNQLTDDKDFNVFNYRNFYNGGGVALGDINNDSLPDVFMISNMKDNKLYLNKGNFKFEDITQQAGVAGKRAWSTGATFADINADGWIDIYVCNSGNRSSDDRANELYINNGDNTFTEKAAVYGLNDRGFSTHAAFFDYDRDGDLDMYLLNNSFIPIGTLQYANLREQRDVQGGDKLFRNDGNTFVDVSDKAGIYGSVIGFGLGITIGDVNNDNWMDIYISNDFYERDYLYINNKNGTFTEASKNWMQHISLSSMGADIADINNDGTLDIFVTDMLPENDVRLKTTSTFEGYDLFQLKVSRDFYHQYMHNMLHINNGDNTFSEVGRLAGVHATDWSWGALLFDMDNDGLKDIFVANGIAKDLTDQDVINFLNDEKNIQKVKNAKSFNFKEFLDKINSKPVPNYAFKNSGNLQFENVATAWGLDEASFSNGAAYGDLDNDGDLDLVINNVNMPSWVFKNHTTEKLKHNFLRVKLSGDEKNKNGIGAKVKLHQSGKESLLQQMPNRGFQSSVDLTMVFGLGKERSVDSLSITWPDDKVQVIREVNANTTITLHYQNAKRAVELSTKTHEKVFTDVTKEVKFQYLHHENNFVDYNRDALLKQQFSTQGPALASGDVNGDGYEDLYIGGASGGEKKLFIQNSKGLFMSSAQNVFQEDILSEDVAALFFDADNDKDLDLYVVTGSNEFESGSGELADRLYVNDGKGNFSKDNRLPALSENGSCVAASDFDKDGDIDLFIGGRMIPGQYGYDAPSFLYINDGLGGFKNYTKRYLPKNEIGMVTDATWADVDGDGYPELIVVGDWMSVTVFKNQQGKSLIQNDQSIIANSSGWWNVIKPADIDADGDLDFVVGNLGENSRLVADKDTPAELYVHDFGENGKVKQIITCYAKDGKSYPMVLKHDLQKQVPAVKKKFVKYADYAGKPITEILSPEELQKAVVKTVTNPFTSVIINKGNFKFDIQPLPLEAQYSSIHSIELLDYNNDNNLDILLAGNFFDLLPEMGRYDANYGLVLKGNGQGNFQVVKNSGYFLKGQVRRSEQIKSADGKTLIVLAKNNDHAQIFKVK